MTDVRAIILVVDDEDSLRTVLRLALNHAGYRVLTAANGEDALDVMSRGMIEVVLLDVKMPRLSGLEVLLRARAEHPEIAIIMVSAVADESTRAEAIKMGACDYVVKPFDLDDMIARVGKRVGRSARSGDQKSMNGI